MVNLFIFITLARGDDSLANDASGQIDGVEGWVLRFCGVVG